MILGLSPLQIALALAVVFVAALLQGAVGMGFSLLAAPLLALVEPALAPQAVLGAASVLSLLAAVRERQAIAPAEIGWALVGYLPGAVVAALLLARLPTGALSLLFAALVLLAVALTALRMRLVISPRTLLPVGLVSGFMGTIAAISGPPIALLFQHREGRHIRATLGLYFFAGGLLSIAVLAFGGRYGLRAAAHSLMLLPAVLAGFALSGRFIPYLDRGPLRPLILLICAASAIAVIARTVAGL